MTAMKFVKALVELALLTYLAGFFGLISADGFDLTSLGAWKAAAIAALPPVLVVVYGVLSGVVGNYNSPLLVDTRDSSDGR
jgi:hypothetical protein